VFDGEWRGGGVKIDKISPIDGRRLASVRAASDDDYNSAVSRGTKLCEMARHAGTVRAKRFAASATRCGN